MSAEAAPPEPFHREPGVTLYCGEFTRTVPLLPRRLFSGLRTTFAVPPWCYYADIRALQSGEVPWTADAEALQQARVAEWYRTGLAWTERLAEEANGRTWLVVHHYYLAAVLRAGFLLRRRMPQVWTAAGHVEVLACLGDRVGTAGSRALQAAMDASTNPMEDERLLALCVLQEDAGLVFDPFAGTGRTLAVARRLGHPVLGVEIEEEQCAKAVARLRAEERR